MLENRRHFRLREFIDVTWKVENQEESGEGTIVNISSSGLLLQTDKVFKPTDNCVLSIAPDDKSSAFSPRKGKLMWFSRIHTPNERYRCGIKFLGDTTDQKFQQWFDLKVSQLSEAGDAKILNNMAF